MAFITAEERYRLGYPELDAQHAGLFELVNRLHEGVLSGAGRPVLGGLMARLRQETMLHFLQEETLMRRTGYPGLDAHKRLHDDLARQVSDLEAKHRGGSLAVSQSVMNFLKDWLVHHILNEDRRLAEHLREAGA